MAKKQSKRARYHEHSGMERELHGYKNGHARQASGLMRGYDDKAYDYDGSTMGTKRNVTGNAMGRYDEGMLNGEGQFANMPQHVVMKAWPKSPTGELAEYPNGLNAADAQMRRDKKGVKKVGLPNKG